MAKTKVVARLTVTREIGNLTIIEVHEDATFSRFYHIFTQVGRRRSTKRPVRCASRNEGLRPWFRAHLMQPGLARLAEHWQKQPGVVSVTIRIIAKRAYARLVHASPDQLELAKTSVKIPMQAFPPLAIPIRLPARAEAAAS